MRVSVQYDARDAERLVGTLSMADSYLRNSIDGMAEELGMVAKGAVLTAIYNQMSNEAIGRFMFHRTNVDVQFSDGTVYLTVNGKPEGQVANPTRSDGTVPTVSNAAVNLWMTHEFGIPSSGGGSQKMVFEKDDGGIKVVRQGAGYGMGSPYVGEIRSIIAGLGPSLERAFAMFVKGAGYAAVANVLRVGGMDIQVNALALGHMRDSGAEIGDLKGLGIDKVDVTGRGQINYLGTNPGGTRTFISGKSAGLPTTINR